METLRASTMSHPAIIYEAFSLDRSTNQYTASTTLDHLETSQLTRILPRNQATFHSGRRAVVCELSREFILLRRRRGRALSLGSAAVANTFNPRVRSSNFRQFDRFICSAALPARKTVRGKQLFAHRRTHDRCPRINRSTLRKPAPLSNEAINHRDD